jgi:hypothetical protein
MMPHHFTGPNHRQTPVFRAVADLMAEKALVGEGERETVQTTRELVEQARVNPEVLEVIGPKRTVQVTFFVGNDDKFDFLVQKCEELGQFGIGTTQVRGPSENDDFGTNPVHGNSLASI